jgi:hypoxanthine phosphoribosyltransferase
MNKEQSFTINGRVFVPMISREKIDLAVEGIAGRINKDYKKKNPVFVIVLKGGVFFGCDLLRKLTVDCTLETVSAKSYGEGMQSSGNVRIYPEHFDFKGRDVVIVEDIVDTGHTLKVLMESFEKMDVSSFEAAALLSKPSMREVVVNVKYIGIEIPPVFVIGYGLDYAEQGRHLPDIYSATT